MLRAPKVLELVVDNNLCIGCGLCTYTCKNNSLKMEWDDHGFLIPNQIRPCDCNGDCISVCPFNPYPDEEVRTENELSNIFLGDSEFYEPKVGKYNHIYAGYSIDYRLTSSSGGIATFVLIELLKNGIVDHIFSVNESSQSDIHYEYSICSNEGDLLASSKTKYFPVTLSDVFSKLDKIEGKVAIVGVACFIKAIRLAQYTQPILKEKIPFLVGIICGGVKSRFFTEYLAEKAGVNKNNYSKPEFRIKNTDSTAGDYSFGCINNLENNKKTVRMGDVGDMWGTGLFKSNACDFCDDVTTELADISVGDAWMPPFVSDGKGTSIIVTRSVIADKIIRNGINSKKLKIEPLSLKDFVLSQKGSYNHRHNALAYREKYAIKRNKLVPPKRFNKNKITFILRLVQFLRINTRKMSLEIWRKANNAAVFDRRMRIHLWLLKFLTIFQHAIKKIS